MESAVGDYLDELEGRIQGEVRRDDYTRVLYSTDASIFQVMPYAVVIPKTAEDVQAAVEAAAKYKVPLLPRTAGSSLSGQAVNAAVVIDMSRHLDGVVELNREEQWIRVQPGIVLDALNLYLRPHGLLFGPDPASSDRACMGGIVSNNSTGSHSILYGMTTDHVLESKVVLSDGSTAHLRPLETGEVEQYRQRSGLEGEIYRRIGDLTADEQNQATIRAGTPRHWRRCGGYNLDRFIPDGVNFKWPKDPRMNLAKLVSGAEGTLAVMTEIKLNLVRLPKMTALAIVHFDSLYEALAAVPVMLEVGPSAVELLDNLGLTLCRDVPTYARLLTTFTVGQPNCVLITEFYGESEAELKGKIGRLEEHLQQNQIKCQVVPAMTPQIQSNVWTVRKVGLGLMMSIKGDYKPIPFIEDAAVPVEYLAEYVTRIEKFCNDIGTNVAYYAHASAGCIHIRPLINAKLANEVAKLRQIGLFSMELVGEYGGALSSEHGDGRARSWLNEGFFGRELYGLFRQVKGVFDPENRLNPGNVVESPDITQNLRYGGTYQVIPLKTHLDFSSDQGFDRAVEMCNGAGICRKRITGTMCPSFMVTREEEHSTRGRANALRAAMSGRLATSEFTSPRMYQVMDLCIECKACKAECPSSVDMAKIKFEFMAHYHEAHGTPLRARLFADIARLSRWSSGRLAPLANLVLGNGLARWVMEKGIGVSRQRTLPPFAREPFTTWFEKRRRGTQGNLPSQGRGQELRGIQEKNNLTDGRDHGREERGSQGPRLAEMQANLPSQGEGRNSGELKNRQVVLFHDTFNTFNYPHISIAATEFLEAAGYQVILPGHKCCGRPMVSKGLVDKAKAMAADTVGRLYPFAQAGLPIVGLEPSCLLMLRDEYLYLLPNDERAQVVAKQALTFEEFVAKAAEAGELEVAFTAESRRLLLHGHCHQKSLVGTGPSKQVLSLPPGYEVSEVDSGCCGMAGSFGYEAEHYDISLKMAERRLLPAVREADGETIVVAAGVSCRQQIKHGTGRVALHPAEVLREAMKRGGD
jgi:FAD/FMN-containing dehydrogenase/Fe-S oxidoreductase